MRKIFISRKSFASIGGPLVPMEKEPQQTSDEDLARRVQGGDRNAFARLVEKNAQRYYRVAYRITGDAAEAEDRVQSAFLKFWQYPLKWNPGLGWKFSTWFSRVVVNLCLDQKRKRNREMVMDRIPEAPSEVATEETLMQAERNRRVEAGLRTLPDRQRAALALCFYEGFSNAQAAEAMGLGLKALQSLLMRAKASLREKVLQMEKRKP